MNFSPFQNAVIWTAVFVLLVCFFPVSASAGEGIEKYIPAIEVLFQPRLVIYPADDESSTFRLRRAELAFKGKVTEWAGYVIEADPARDDILRQGYAWLGKHKQIELTLGQFKAPLGREELDHSEELPFVERAEVTHTYAPAEELGIGGFWKCPIVQAGLSLTNGTGTDLDNNEWKDITGRLVAAPVEWVEVGGAVQYGRVMDADNELDRLRIGGELYAHGSSQFFQGEFIYEDLDELQSYGLYLEGGWGFATGWKMPEKLEVVLRYEMLDPDMDGEDDGQSIITPGVNIYLKGHHSKIQLNYLAILEEGDDIENNELQLQYQLFLD